MGCSLGKLHILRRAQPFGHTPPWSGNGIKEGKRKIKIHRLLEAQGRALVTRTPGKLPSVEAWEDPSGSQGALPVVKSLFLR